MTKAKHLQRNWFSDGIATWCSKDVPFSDADSSIKLVDCIDCLTEITKVGAIAAAKLKAMP